MADLLNLHPEVQKRLSRLREWARSAGVPLTVTSGFRSISEQKRLYADAQAGKRILPAAPPGESTHNYGFAVDIVTSKDRLQDLVRAAGCAGFVWAGASDPVHFDVFGRAAWQAILQGRVPALRYNCPVP